MVDTSRLIYSWLADFRLSEHPRLRAFHTSDVRCRRSAWSHTAVNSCYRIAQSLLELCGEMESERRNGVGRESCLIPN